MVRRIWMPKTWRPLDLTEIFETPGSYAFPNHLEVEGQLAKGSDEPLIFRRERWSLAEPLRVEIRVRELALDYWSSPSGALVSARLREAWAPASNVVEYIAVDTSGSCPEARAKDYKLIHVLAEETVVDPAMSDYDSSEAIDWLPKGFPFVVRNFAILQGAAPSGHLFRDTFARNEMFCTDTLAVRTLSIGCTGIWFVDPAAQHLAQPVRYRSLAGVSETHLGISEKTTLVERI